MPLIIDYAEKRSGIPDLLKNRGIDTVFNKLDAGDYIINNEIIIERKSSLDFIQSLISGRLFQQFVKIRKFRKPAILLIEGDPYATQYKISRDALTGAFVSISIAWQIPVLFSSGREETARLLEIALRQRTKEKIYYPSGKHVVKRKHKPHLSFLAGLPGIGTKTAEALLEQFGSIRSLVNASLKSLMKTKGIGKKRATEIYNFLYNSYSKPIVR